MEPRIEISLSQASSHDAIQNASSERMTETEKEVANFLDELDLHWRYEAPVFLWDNEGRPRVWNPDFYLPKLGLHIEVWNSAEVSTEYREKAYKKNGIQVIFVHTFKDKDQWKNFLVSRITAIEEQRHSQIVHMLLGTSLKRILPRF